MTFFSNLFARFNRHPTPGSSAAKHAIAVSDELIQQMRDRSNSNDAARALMADIWAQRHNVPFMTTVFEAAREMKDATQYSGRVGANDNG